MVAMWMMQVTVDQVVDMVAVRHRLVAAVWTMLVAFWMTAAVVVWRAAVGVRRAHGHDVLIEMILMRMMQMAIMQVVDMAVVPYRSVTAARAMLVRMVAMDVMVAHERPSFVK
jgi:hypothetical protein